VLDSEDENSDMEVKTDGVGVVPADGPGGQVLSMEGPPVVDADEASEIDLAPEVAARLKKVLANIDPIYHGVFVSMCKYGLSRTEGVPNVPGGNCFYPW